MFLSQHFMPESPFSKYLVRALAKALTKISDPSSNVAMFEDYVGITALEWIAFREYYISPKSEDWNDDDDDSDHEVDDEEIAGKVKEVAFGRGVKFGMMSRFQGRVRDMSTRNGNIDPTQS